MSNFEDIYETMLGLREEGFQVPGVENAFSDGSLCAESYEKMRSAYARICFRLGVQDEDPDLETIVSAMEAIQRDLCRRIYAQR